MSSNRELVRDGLATLLTTALAGTGGIVQAVYNYRIGDFAGASPVVTVSNRGILRKRGSFAGDRAAVLLQVDVFVLYADGASWGEDEAEDRLDAIEKGLAGVLDANQQTATWVSIEQTEPSARVDVMVGGVEYIREVFVIGAEVWG